MKWMDTVVSKTIVTKDMLLKGINKVGKILRNILMDRVCSIKGLSSKWTSNRRYLYLLVQGNNRTLHGWCREHIERMDGAGSTINSRMAKQKR